MKSRYLHGSEDKDIDIVPIVLNPDSSEPVVTRTQTTTILQLIALIRMEIPLLQQRRRQKLQLSILWMKIVIWIVIKMRMKKVLK